MATKSEARRASLLDALRSANAPVSGGQLANTLSVSRQIIVQDIALLREAGANIYDLDQSVPTQEVIDTADETESKVLCISTHNGMAYGYAKELSDKLKEAGLDDVLVIMGGLLNEALPGKNLPEDVSGLVAELGFNVDNNAEDIVNVIAKHAGKEA